MNSQTPEDGYELPASIPDPVRVWAAYGVSAAAGLHLIVAAVVLINHAH